MQYGAVAYVAVYIDQRVAFSYAMNNTAGLDVGPLLDRDAGKVAPQARQRAYVHARPDNDIADQYGRWMHISAGIHNGRNAINGIDFKHGRVSVTFLIIDQDFTPPGLLQFAVHTSWIDCLMGFEQRSEEHTSELQSLMRISYAVFCL